VIAPLWKLWEVSVQGYPPFVFSAASRGKALAKSYSDYTATVGHMGFKEFLRIASARRYPFTLPNHYDVIKRQYGISDIHPGQRVELVNEGPSTGERGTVQYASRPACHFHVVLDQNPDHYVIVHPMNVRAVS
jgi:hypothetical protein